MGVISFTPYLKCPVEIKRPLWIPLTHFLGRGPLGVLFIWAGNSLRILNIFMLLNGKGRGPRALTLTLPPMKKGTLNSFSIHT